MVRIARVLPVKSAIKFLRLWPLACLLAFAPFGASLAAPISVIDDTNQTVTVPAPAKRIVSLAPHTTELLYAAGAGRYLVGVSQFSDYPTPAKNLPVIGSSAALDLERIILLKPDLVVAWSSGNSALQVQRLKRFGIPVFESEPHDFAGIAANIERLAQLAGTDRIGREAAAAFLLRLQAISKTYSKREPVTVFYQVWTEPLMTLNDKHMVSSVLRLCGGRNIFGQLAPLTPVVGVEDVVQANPEVIIAGSSAENNAPSGWRRFEKMIAVSRGNLHSVDPDLLTRAGPRILDGAELVCRQLETARTKRP